MSRSVRCSIQQPSSCLALVEQNSTPYSVRVSLTVESAATAAASPGQKDGSARALVAICTNTLLVDRFVV
ncbi:hypothetical protein RJ55_06248 [Drechmeria coniospora]|nr:hypothetical protein RJ55_06248 [Drechmeria coniospora]